MDSQLIILIQIIANAFVFGVGVYFTLTGYLLHRKLRKKDSDSSSKIFHMIIDKMSEDQKKKERANPMDYTQSDYKAYMDHIRISDDLIPFQEWLAKQRKEEVNES